MGFEKSDSNQPDGNEWQSFQHRETGGSSESPENKDKKKDKKGGKHRASDSRPAFKLPIAELDNDVSLAERRRSSWTDAAFEGHDKADKDDDSAEIWKRGDKEDVIADAESVTDNFAAGDVEIRLHNDIVAQPAQHGELVSEDVAEEPTPVPEYPEQPAPQPKSEASATSLRDILAGYPLPVAETVTTSNQEAPQEAPHEEPAIEHQAQAETADVVEEEPVSDIPPVPPSFSEYQRLIWGSEAEEAELRIAMAAEMSATGAGGSGEMTIDAPAAAPLYGTSRKRYSSDIPEGYQRSTSDVSRAAWTGVAAGWWLGRRGKRKAVEAAQAEGYQKGHAAATEVASKTNNYDVLPEQMPTLEAAPIHDIPRSETEHDIHESRTTVMPTSVEVSRQKEPMPAEHSTTNFAKNIEASPEAPITNDMGRGELMRIAKEIKIEGISLKDIYNAKRIDKEGLQAVVEVYLRGGDVKKQLSEEILVKEQSFERDPLLRRVRSSPQAEKLRQGVSSVAVAAGGLLAKIGGQVAAASQETAKKATKAVSAGAKQAQHDIIDTSDSADWIGITAVVIVYSLILILIFN